MPIVYEMSSLFLLRYDKNVLQSLTSRKKFQHSNKLLSSYHLEKHKLKLDVCHLPSQQLQL